MHSLQVTIIVTTLFFFLIGTFVFVPLPYVAILAGLLLILGAGALLVSAAKNNHGPHPR